jgi:hypothetical protein
MSCVAPSGRSVSCTICTPGADSAATATGCAVLETSGGAGTAETATPRAMGGGPPSACRTRGGGEYRASGPSSDVAPQVPLPLVPPASHLGCCGTEGCVSTVSSCRLRISALYGSAAGGGCNV